MTRQMCVRVGLFDDDGAFEDVLSMSSASVRWFCNRIVDCAFAGDIGYAEFALGYCAALDSLSNATLMPGNPLVSVAGSYHDVHCVTDAPRSFTDVLRAYGKGSAR